MKRLLATVAAVASLVGSAAHAALDLRPATPGGSKQVYQLGNGDLLGLWGFSGGVNAILGSSQSTSDLISAFRTQDQPDIVGFYYSKPTGGSWAGDPDEFEALGATFEIESTDYSDKLFDSLWVRWTGGDLFNAASNSNMNAGDVNLAGDPLAPIPVPAALPLLILGLGGLGLYARRQRSAAAV
jgi:hypothetical protein